jgi:hypothetical protein
MDKSKEYERFVQFIYQSILNSEGYDNIKVDHDVYIVDRFENKRQIDVYWEFKMGGITHEVCIECRCWNSKVTIEDVDAFIQKLEDLRGLKGVMATTIGFQSGAINKAKPYGLTLVEIRKPTEEDWDGRVKTICFNISAFFTNILKRDFDIRKEDNLGMPDTFQISGSEDVIFIYDDSHEPVKSIYDLQNEYTRVEKTFEETPATEAHIDFTEPVYIRSDDGDFIRIRAYNFTYEIKESKEYLEIKGDDFVLGLVKNITEGGGFLIHKDGKVLDLKYDI